MALLTMYRVLEIKPKRMDEGIFDFYLLDNNAYPKFTTKEDALEWIRDPQNYQKEWTVLEVFIDEKYVK